MENVSETNTKTKFCQHCGNAVSDDTVVCSSCGKQVGKINGEFQTPNIVLNVSSSSNNSSSNSSDSSSYSTSSNTNNIDNSNDNTNNNANLNSNRNSNTNFNAAGMAYMNRPRNKWAAFIICLFFGYFGAHKFYEGKITMGVIYLLTCGLCGIGWIVDIIIILSHPNPYYVY